MVPSKLCDNLILVRTREGQRSIFEDIELEHPQRRLLLMVNGFTPFGHWVNQLGTQGDWSTVASQLMERGLVEAVKEPDGEPEG
jgi:hypothetical protein